MEAKAKNTNETFLNLLKKEVVPALGCTEPIAVALAVAKARETLGERPDRVDVRVSANIFKNGMGVGIPGTGMTGLPIAAALGAIHGNSSDRLELLKDISKEIVNDALGLVEKNKVKVGVKENTEKLYVEAVCTNSSGIEAKAIITSRHSNISRVELNGKVIDTGDRELFQLSGTTSPENITLSVEEIFHFSVQVPLHEIEFLLRSVKMNLLIAEEGLKNNYGLQVGKKLKENIEKGILSDDLMNAAMSLTAAACDARMAGLAMPVMSNSGSGNQGITATLPIVAASRKLGSSNDKLIRALALSHLIAIHVKNYLGRLSALCGCVVAAASAGCGICYLLGGGEKEVIYTIKNMIGNVTGMICDGAKEGCALKVSSGVGSAIQSALLALDGIVISSNDGIIEDDVEKTIKNLGEIGSKGMAQTDELLLRIMVSKC